MEYTMEELVPIVRKLAEKHHGYESTSMTYEKAEQLMEAVLYCVRETEQINALLPEEKPSAQTAYETGAKAVKEKTKRALKWYNDLLPKFNSFALEYLIKKSLKEPMELLEYLMIAVDNIVIRRRMTADMSV